MHLTPRGERERTLSYRIIECIIIIYIYIYVHELYFLRNLFPLLFTRDVFKIYYYYYLWFFETLRPVKSCARDDERRARGRESVNPIRRGNQLTTNRNTNVDNNNYIRKQQCTLAGKGRSTFDAIDIRCPYFFTVFSFAFSDIRCHRPTPA
jgi:hypothetical protein